MFVLFVDVLPHFIKIHSESRRLTYVRPVCGCPPTLHKDTFRIKNPRRLTYVRPACGCPPTLLAPSRKPSSGRRVPLFVDPNSSSSAPYVAVTVTGSLD